MKTLTNYSELLELVNETRTVCYDSLDLEFDLFEYAECEREVKGYTVKDFENGISLIEASKTHFVLTSMVSDVISNLDEFYGNN